MIKYKYNPPKPLPASALADDHPRSGDRIMEMFQSLKPLPACLSSCYFVKKKKKEWWLFFVLVAVLAALFDFLTSWHIFFFDNDSHPLLKDGLQRLFYQTVQSINDCYTLMATILTNIYFGYIGLQLTDPCPTGR